MNVKVCYLGVLRNFTGKAEEEINLEKESNLLDLIKLLSQKYGDRFSNEFFDANKKQFKAGYGAILNGKLVSRLRGLSTPLNNGDKIILTLLISGG